MPLVIFIIAALALLGVSVVLTMIVPIPRRHCKALFDKRVQLLLDERPDMAAKLTLALMRDD